MSWLPLLLLVPLLAVTCWTDVRTGKILNQHTLPIALLGVSLHLLLPELRVGVSELVPSPITFGLAGFGLATALHFPLWRLGVEKAGDAKLIMAHGALMGWHEMLELSAWCAVLYVPVGVVLLTIGGRWANFVAIARFELHRLLKLLPEGPNAQLHTALAALGIRLGAEAPHAPAPTMLRTAPLIAAGAALAFLTDWGALLASVSG